jgi:hypothetical protein
MNARTKRTMTLFPKIFFSYFVALGVYIRAFPYGFHYLALIAASLGLIHGKI